MGRPPVGLVVTDAEPSCLDVLETIQSYADCECDASTMLAVAAHLDACPECRAELEALQALKAKVRRCNRSLHMRWIR